VPETRFVEVFLPLLRDLARWWDAAEVPGVVIGGVAVAVLGRPRTTRDVDGVVLVDEHRWEEFLHAGAAFGFVPRVHDVLPFARLNRVLLLRHDPTSVNVDISLGWLPFEEEMLQRRAYFEVQGVRVPVPTPEDLITLKVIAGRDQDRIDVIGLLDAHPALDLSRVRSCVEPIAAALDSPDLLEWFEQQVARRNRPGGSGVDPL
jgi:hypothetical protein